jgi:hypothetical protein
MRGLILKSPELESWQNTRKVLQKVQIQEILTFEEDHLPDRSYSCLKNDIQTNPLWNQVSVEHTS